MKSDTVVPDSPPPEAGGVEIAPGVRVAESALRWQFSRSGGPGGQNVNKVNTKAELWIPVAELARGPAGQGGLSEAALSRLRQLAGRRLTQADEIHVASDTGRTQESNRRLAMERLRELVIEAMRVPAKRRITRPSKGAKRRRLESKRQRGQIKAGRAGKSDSDW